MYVVDRTDGNLNAIVQKADPDRICQSVQWQIFHFLGIDLSFVGDEATMATPVDLHRRRLRGSVGLPEKDLSESHVARGVLR
jgi:hypothetical protein